MPKSKRKFKDCLCFHTWIKFQIYFNKDKARNKLKKLVSYRNKETRIWTLPKLIKVWWLRCVRKMGSEPESQLWVRRAKKRTKAINSKITTKRFTKIVQSYENGEWWRIKIVVNSRLKQFLFEWFILFFMVIRHALSYVINMSYNLWWYIKRIKEFKKTVAETVNNL